ncbi:MAG: hypothetical protein AAFZ15_11140 [Bacteroidota bacterium]
MNAKIPAFLLFVISISLCACESDKGKDIPDVSDINVSVDLKRFDRALFSIDTNNVLADLAQLELDYGEFAAIYFGQILGSKDTRIAPDGHEAYVKGFVAHPGARQLYDTTQAICPDLSGVKQELEQAFRFFKYYFPEQPLSGEVVTYISEYTVGGFLYGENSIGVGLDFYLGATYPYQQFIPANPNFSAYLTRTFNKDHIAMKSVKLLVQDLLGSARGNKLLDYMVHNGKELYLLDQLLPNLPDSVKLEYSQPQVDWVNENEANIWAYLISEDLIYSSELGEFRKYIEYSPNSPGMPDEAPGRTANWLGWQIVKAYMDRYPETSLQELINLRDAQELMDRSRYKPKRG